MKEDNRTFPDSQDEESVDGCQCNRRESAGPRERTGELQCRRGPVSGDQSDYVRRMRSKTRHIPRRQIRAVRGGRSAGHNSYMRRGLAFADLKRR